MSLVVVVSYRRRYHCCWRCSHDAMTSRANLRPPDPWSHSHAFASMMDAASSHAAHLAHAHSQSAWRHRDSCQCCCLSARRTSPTLPASHHGLSRNLSAYATMRVAIAQLSGAARESEPALKNHAICSDPDRTGLRDLIPVQCIDDKANSWPLCFQLL